MASTYRPSDALDLCKRMIKNMPLQQIQVRVLDTALKVMWMGAPWRWTLGNLPNITLASNTQSYSVALPSDFLFAVQSFQTDQLGGIPRPYAVVSTIASGGLQGQGSMISFSGTAGSTGTALITPTPGTLPVSPTQAIITLYKKISPIITAQNMFTQGLQVFDDEYFHVYESGVLWAAYLFGDDQRAGGAQMDSRGQYSFTGQRAIFEANIEWMRGREPLLIDMPRQVPDPKILGR